MKTQLKQISAIALGVMALGVGTISASAQTSVGSTADFGLSEGNIAVTTPVYSSSGINTVNTTAGDTTVVYDMGTVTQDVGDVRGTGEGWTIQIQATPLTEVEPATGWDDPLNPDPIVIPSGMTVNNVTVAGEAGLSSEATELVPSATQTIDGGSAVTLVTAGTDAGYGIYNLSTDLKMEVSDSQQLVDSHYYPETPTPYESTITSTIVFAP